MYSQLLRHLHLRLEREGHDSRGEFTAGRHSRTHTLVIIAPVFTENVITSSTTCTHSPNPLYVSLEKRDSARAHIGYTSAHNTMSMPFTPFMMTTTLVMTSMERNALADDVEVEEAVLFPSFTRAFWA